MSNLFKFRVLLFLGFAALCLNAHSQNLTKDRIEWIDAYALAAPDDIEQDPMTLADYLTQPMLNDTEKARAIFRWITDRINYDVDAFLNNRALRTDAAETLKRRISICEGYAALFEKMGAQAGLEIVTIRGYAKGFGHTTLTGFSKPNHAWNAVKIDGRWQLIDSTWGAGYVSNGKYIKALNETFFLAPPEQMMFTHFPETENWQLQSIGHISQLDFESLPNIDPAFFFLGFPGELVWRTIKQPGFSGNFVGTYQMNFHGAIVQHAPIEHDLHLGEAQAFAIDSTEFEKISFVLNERWTELPKHDAHFEGEYAPTEKGPLLVVGKKIGAENYTAILSYQVN